MNDLLEYLKNNLIKFEQLSENIVKIEDKTYQLVFPDKDGVLFDSLFQMTCDDTEEDNYVFEFGGKWYWTPKGTETNPQLNLLKYIGEANIELPYLPWLGIHGKYEILNGSRDYKDWCKKAKFLKCDTLGICELNTLAGVLQFQEECKSNDIKSVIGETFIVRNQKQDLHYRIKLYAKNEQGWPTLLKFNKSVNVDNNGFVDEDYFWNNINSNCIVVVDPKYCDFEYIVRHFFLIENLYYQLDTVQYDNQDSDKKYLENLGKFIKSSIKPILIQDSYYLDKEDAYIKTKLNQISGDREFKSSNQYFKCFDQIFDELDTIFDKNSNTFDSLLDEALKSVYIVSKQCNFEVKTNQKFLPKYIMTEQEEKEYQTNEELFWSIVNEAFDKKTPKNKRDKYLERLKYEVDTIKLVKGNNGSSGIDYFLILWDIVKYCEENGILLGHGRGSSGGSIVAWYLNIVKTDPIEWNLLFERFLNPGRIESLPDIDIDVMPSKKEEVKMYMSKRYGFDYFCYIGTYTTLQLKALITDLARLSNFSIAETKYITSVLDLEDGNLRELFINGCKNIRIKNFIKNFPEIINSIDLIIGMPKSKSIHACGTVIVPKEKTIYEWFPVRLAKNKNDENILVSEWDGKYLEKAGFLKEDILVIDQLDKYYDILSLIKEKINIYDIDVKDENLYDYFRKGYTQDIFQFGTDVFVNYLKQLKPDNIHELIHAVALNRPGATKVNSHIEYILRKNDESKISYKFGTEDITKDTYGLMIMQEQVILLCQSLGGFSLAEGDVVRKSVGKKDLKLMEEQKIKFINGAIKNGCPKNEAEDIWHDIEVHGSYSFNNSHSVNYTHVSCVGMYFKKYYPLEFWTIAFSYDTKNEYTAKYISEINQTGDIQMFPPSINKSGDGFTPDFNTNSIYWSLNSVKQCGDKAVEQIVEDKKKNGDYFSFSEFLERNMFKGSKTSKAVVEHLVLCGSFDEIEKIKHPKDRYELIEAYRKKSKAKIDKEKDLFSVNQDMLQYNWWWSLQQKRLCGFALFDLEMICENYLDSDSKYMDAISIQDRESIKKNIVTGGYINEIVVRQSKKGEYADIILDNNFEFITVKLWQDAWSVAKSIFENKEKCLLLLSGQVSYDKFKKRNIVTLFEDSDILVLE